MLEYVIGYILLVVFVQQVNYILGWGLGYILFLQLAYVLSVVFVLQVGYMLGRVPGYILFHQFAYVLWADIGFA